MVYLVAPLEDNPKLLSHIQRLDPSAYTRHAPRLYFLNYRGTTADLTEELGFRKTRDEVGKMGVVMKLSRINGLAYGDLWEWIEERE